MVIGGPPTPVSPQVAIAISSKILAPVSLVLDSNLKSKCELPVSSPFQNLKHMNAVDGSHHLLIVPKHKGHNKLKFTISVLFSYLFSMLSSISLQNLWQSNPDQTFVKSEFSSGGQMCSLVI